MKKIKCPSCDDGIITMIKVKNYPAKLGGIEFVVPEAEFAVCDSCGKKVYSAKEIKRWKNILLERMKNESVHRIVMP